jgi:hypothetical protein
VIARRFTFTQSISPSLLYILFSHIISNSGLRLRHPSSYIIIIQYTSGLAPSHFTADDHFPAGTVHTSQEGGRTRVTSTKAQRTAHLGTGVLVGAYPVMFFQSLILHHHLQHRTNSSVLLATAIPSLVLSVDFLRSGI